MANNLYNKGAEKFAQGLINWNTADVKAVLVDVGAYTLNLTHEFLSSIAAGARIATSASLAAKSSVDGACDANDITFTAVSGVSCEAIVLYIDSGDPATSSLIAYIDTAPGLPITPNGGDIIVTWDNGTNKIFKL